MLLRKNDSGRSIVEMLGVLAIMGVITVMGISGYSQAVGKINRNSVVEQVVKLAQETRGLFAGRGSYNEDDTKTESYDIAGTLLTKMGLKLENPYGQKYTVDSFGSTGNNPGFVITIPGVSQDDCLYFTTMAWNDTLDEAEPHSVITNKAYSSCDQEGSGNVVSVYFR